MISGNLYVYTKDGFVYVKAENCGDEVTLSHNVFETESEAMEVHSHDDAYAAVREGSGRIDAVSNVVIPTGDYQHGVPIARGTPDAPSVEAYRLRLGLRYGEHNPGGPIAIAPGKFLRVGLRGIAYGAVKIPEEGEVAIVPYTDLRFDQGAGTSTLQYRGPAVVPRLSSGATSDVAALMRCSREGVMVRGELRIVPKADPDDPNELAGWEVWFENTAPVGLLGSLKTGFTGTFVMINPGLPEEANGHKNAGLGIESMPCPEGGFSAMQILLAGGDYGKEEYGIEAAPGASFRAGVRGYSSMVGTLPSLAEGPRVYSLQSFARGSSVEASKFFDGDEIRTKMGEKKNRVGFFRDGASVNHELEDVVYRGMEALQKADLPPPRVVVEWLPAEAAWRIAITSTLPLDPADPAGERCGDRHGRLGFAVSLGLRDGEQIGTDLAKLGPHVLTRPGEAKEWLLKPGVSLNGISAEAGRELRIDTHGLGWIAFVRLPDGSGPVEATLDEGASDRRWELWETQHARARLFPDDPLGDAATLRADRIRAALGSRPGVGNLQGAPSRVGNATVQQTDGVGLSWGTGWVAVRHDTGEVFAVVYGFGMMYSHDGHRAALGAPKSDEYGTETGARQDFDGGYLEWVRATNQVLIHVNQPG